MVTTSGPPGSQSGYRRNLGPLSVTLMLALMDIPTKWMEQGNCRNFAPAVFFPADGAGVDRARKVCASCPVMQACLEYALAEHIDHGVWGGCSERERRRIAKRRRAAAKL